jgi:homoserine kinase
MTPSRACEAFAPATVANLACGFDVLGLALEEPGDRVSVSLAEEPGIHLMKIEGDDGRLPQSAEHNTASVAVRKLLEHEGLESEVGLRMTLAKGLPLASGMGSSAASAVAGVVAAKHLLELETSLEGLLSAAIEGERLVAGSGHPDNAAACLYGGLVLARAAHPPDVIRLPVPDGMSVVVVHPHLELSTRDSRILLGDSVSLKNAVAQWANLGALVAGLYTQDWELISRSLVDHVAEPLRAEYVPGFAAVKRAALDAGALGCSLSGSGPSVFALCRDRKTADVAAGAMSDAFGESAGVGTDAYVSSVSARGAYVLEGKTEPCAT